jgi:outer membrane protein TolC
MDSSATSTQASSSESAVRRWRLLLALLPALAWPAGAATSLDQAVAIAQHNDPWLVSSQFREQAIQARSTAAGSLPDPMVNLGFANLPTDSFDFDQEAMTQFKVGISQAFPRGDSRELDRKRLALLSEQHPYLRDDRRARVAVNVSHLWLEAYRARESIRLIEQDRELFEHLVDVAQSSYSSALGRTRQQDLVRAQLEMTRLEDRLSVLHERMEISSSKLGEWLRPTTGNGSQDIGPEPVAGLPELELLHSELYARAPAVSVQEIARRLGAHPAIRSLDSRIDASNTGVELARQKYRPQWSVNASYGYREDDPVGRDRPDFFSVGVAFDLPLFTSSRQDQQVQSAIADTEVLRTEKQLALRSMLANFETQRARLWRIEQRRQLYQTRLLQEMQEQAEASLTAYTHDDGDFSEVVRARIAELNARIDALDIEVERLKIISQLNYFFATSSVNATGESS